MNKLALNKLTLKVDAVNRVNALTNELVPVICGKLRSFVETKVRKVDGEFPVAFKKFADEIRVSEVGRRVFIIASNYSLWLHIEVMVSDETGVAVYAKNEICIGSIRSSGVLENIADYIKVNYKTDYAVADVIADREALEKAESEARKIEDRLRWFGRYDN